MPAKRKTRPFGAIRELDSGRFQASYIGPGKERVNAPETFDTREAAQDWLTKIKARRDLGMELRDGQQSGKLGEGGQESGTGPSTAGGGQGLAVNGQDEVTLAAYVERWMKHKEMAPLTRESYETM